MYTWTIPTGNAPGNAFLFQFQPGLLIEQDLASVVSNFCYVPINSLSNLPTGSTTVTTSLNGAFLPVAITQHSGMRLVSACLVVRTQSSFTNVGGEIHMALINSAVTPYAIGASGTYLDAYKIAGFQSAAAGRYKKIETTAQRDLKAIWLPNDTADVTDLYPPQSYNSSQIGDSDPMIVGACMATTASQTFVFEAYMNYEFAPNYQTVNGVSNVFAGFESVSTNIKEDPFTTIAMLKSAPYSDHLISTSCNTLGH